MQRLARILVVGVFAAILAGCAAEPMPVATPTPTFTSEAEAFAAAEATYRAYVDALNQVDLADPETFEAVYAWTTGEANSGARESFSQLHADGATVSGVSVVQSVEGVRAELLQGVVELATCLDVSGVHVVAPDGSSLVEPGRVDIQVLTVELQASPSGSTGFLIANTSGRAGDQSC